VLRRRTSCGRFSRADSLFPQFITTQAFLMICTACQAPHQPAQRFCGDCGAALQAEGVSAIGPTAPDAASDSPQLAMASSDRPMGERRDVAILFADLTNFTGLSTESTPKTCTPSFAATPGASMLWCTLSAA
jgi:hypothetical protein